MAQVETSVLSASTSDDCGPQDLPAPNGSAYLRCQFPRNPRRHYDRKSAEADARALAAIWSAIPPEERTMARLRHEAQTCGLDMRIDQVDELEGMEAARFAPWLTLLRAPCRVFLAAEVEKMHPH